MATFEALLTKVQSGKASASEKLELANLLTNSHKEEAKKEKEVKLKKLADLIKSEGLNLKEAIKYLRGGETEAVLIFGPWVDAEGKEHLRHTGARGKAPLWTGDMRRSLKKAEALKLAHGKAGIDFVEKLYAS